MKKITILSAFLLLCSLTFSQSIANYDISITTTWNATDHTSIPTDPHWSPLAVATHKNPNDVLLFGATAPLTDGIKDIAETGNTTNFQAEVNTQITGGNADQYLQQGFSPRGAISTASLNSISISENFPYITLVSMVAPSPDWFIAINSLNLRSGNNAINNGWKDTFTMDVFAYDAGTDDGTDYSSGDAPSNPRQNISMISGAPINGNKMATITFTYNSSTLSSNNEFEKLESLAVFPNPTRNNITISNPQKIEIKNVEIYDTIGKLNKVLKPNNDFVNPQFDVSNLKSGIYFLKFVTANNLSISKKIIIN